MSDEQIENAAKAARAAYGNWFGGWDDDAACPEYKRDDWRNVARAVLAARPPPSVAAGAEVAEVLAKLVEMHFNTDGVIHRSSFEHVRVEALWEYARQVVEAAQSSSKFLPVAPSSAASVDINLTDEEADSFIATVTAAQATTGARAAGGATGGETEALDRAARKMHEFSEMRGLTWERANASRKHGHWHDVMRERAQAVVDAYAAPPVPTAPGVAALLAECARRQRYGPFKPPGAAISCDEIVRLLAPAGADGEGT